MQICLRTVDERHASGIETVFRKMLKHRPWVTKGNFMVTSFIHFSPCLFFFRILSSFPSIVRSTPKERFPTPKKRASDTKTSNFSLQVFKTSSKVLKSSTIPLKTWVTSQLATYFPPQKFWGTFRMVGWLTASQLKVFPMRSWGRVCLRSFPVGFRGESTCMLSVKSLGSNRSCKIYACRLSKLNVPPYLWWHHNCMSYKTYAYVHIDWQL